jgi:hypothetical protein
LPRPSETGLHRPEGPAVKGGAQRRAKRSLDGGWAGATPGDTPPQPPERRRRLTERQRGRTEPTTPRRGRGPRAPRVHGAGPQALRSTPVSHQPLSRPQPPGRHRSVHTVELREVPDSLELDVAGSGSAQTRLSRYRYVESHDASRLRAGQLARPTVRAHPHTGAVRPLTAVYPVTRRAEGVEFRIRGQLRIDAVPSYQRLSNRDPSGAGPSSEAKHSDCRPNP